MAYPQADDDPPGDTMTFAFDSGDEDGIKEFQVNLMDIDCEQLAIPDTEFTATVRMPSSKFQRTIRCAKLLTLPPPWQVFNEHRGGGAECCDPRPGLLSCYRQKIV